LGIGGLNLFAEGERLIELRQLLACLLGWGKDRQSVLDHALHGILTSLASRIPLIVIGDGKLNDIMRRLYRQALGPASEFEMCDPGQDIADIVSRSRPGTLCISMRRKSDVERIITKLRAVHVSRKPQLVLCTQRDSIASMAGKALETSQFLTIPTLSSRIAELGRITDEWAVYVMQELGVSEEFAAASDGTAISSIMKITGRKPWIKTFDDIDDAIQRVVSWKVWGVTQGAQRLGITHSSLSKWLRKRKLTARSSTGVDRDAQASG
jgi:hypothetical protein